MMLPAATAHAEFVIGAYGGWNGSLNSDVTFTDPDTNWTVQDIPWLGLSFSEDGAAPYYGARFIYWPQAKPNWGVMLDFTHAKVRADPNAMVSHSGTLNTVPTAGSAQISSLFDVLEFTDGISLVTVNALYRFEPVGRFRPYVGAGVGINIPHVEVTGNGGTVPFPTTFAYEYGGLAAQVLAGVDVKLTKRLSLFTEYKLSWASVNAPMTGGYRIHTNIITNHILAGVALSFGGN